MSYRFGLRSISNLSGVHEHLRLLMNESIVGSPHDFAITEGLRSLERQRELFDRKATRTMNSRHLTGHAVDIAVLLEGKITWDFDRYKDVADHIKLISKQIGVPVVWGGDWKDFRDGPHFQLPWKDYP